MKRAVAILLCAVFAVSLAACAQTASDEKKPDAARFLFLARQKQPEFVALELYDSLVAHAA